MQTDQKPKLLKQVYDAMRLKDYSNDTKKQYNISVAEQAETTNNAEH